MHPRRVDDILNTYCLRKIVKIYKLYYFTLRRIKDYHTYQTQKYLKHQVEGDSYAPCFNKIDYITEIIRERGYLWRNTEEIEKFGHLITP